MKNGCPDCEYLFQERAAIHQYDGKLSRADAEHRAKSEACAKHKPKETEPEAQKFFAMKD